MSSGLGFVVEAGIATVSINRPERRNALSIEVSNGLTRAWEEINRKPEIRAVILTSADCGTFCAGLDLREAAAVEQKTGKDILKFMDDPFQQRMRDVRVPIIAAMTGHLLAGGMMMSLNCDLRVGMAGTTVGITETRIGRGSPWAMPLLWMVPQPVFMQMVLTGEALAIERMHELGFVNFVEQDPDAVRARAKALAERIRDNAPLSVAAGKASIGNAMSVGCEQALEQANEIYAAVYASDDAQEGPRAFAEKRPPRWVGR